MYFLLFHTDDANPLNTRGCNDRLSMANEAITLCLNPLFMAQKVISQQDVQSLLSRNTAFKFVKLLLANEDHMLYT